MINAEALVNDGLDAACRNNRQTTWTYNQGVLLGGLASLYRATRNATLLEVAGHTANATIARLSPDGVSSQ